MKLRYKLIILGAANAFWILFLLPGILLFSNPGQQTDRIFDVPPSEEALKKLEAGGIARLQVEQLTQNVTQTGSAQDEINIILYECDDRIKAGNVDSQVFLACATFVQNYYKQQAVFLEQNKEASAMINLTGQ